MKLPRMIEVEMSPLELRATIEALNEWLNYTVSGEDARFDRRFVAPARRLRDRLVEFIEEKKSRATRPA